MFDPKTKILVVDDMMTMRKVVSKSCREMGFSDITEAKDGLEAWNAISASPLPFGLIISDWNMPNCTGLELLKKVRSDSKFVNIPFLMVTAESEKTQVAEAIRAGVSNYVIKPFSTAILKEKLEAVYKRVAAK